MGKDKKFMCKKFFPNFLSPLESFYIMSKNFQHCKSHWSRWANILYPGSKVCALVSINSTQLNDTLCSPWSKILTISPFTSFRWIERSKTFCFFRSLSLSLSWVYPYSSWVCWALSQVKLSHVTVRKTPLAKKAHEKSLRSKSKV
jgi:hypothetical protein